MWFPFWLIFSLPPANEVCDGYVFTPVCQSFYSGGGVPGQVPPGRYTPHGSYTPPPRQVHPPPGWYIPQAGTPPAVHAGIRSTSGWYASYWNVFLYFLCSFQGTVGQIIGLCPHPSLINLAPITIKGLKAMF